jgi:hypothetical protein
VGRLKHSQKVNCHGNAWIKAWVISTFFYTMAISNPYFRLVRKTAVQGSILHHEEL